MSLEKKMKKRIGKPIFIAIWALLLLATMPLTTIAAEEKSIAAENVTIKLDGKDVRLTEAARVMDGRLYLPVAQLSKMFGAQVDWDQNNEETTINTEYGDRIVLGNGVPVVYFNGKRYVMDVFPFLVEGRMYIPVRYAAELMHAKLSWNEEEQTAWLESVPLAVVTEQFVIPSILSHEAEPFAEADKLLLAKIMQVEVGDESYESQLAVANVILNRVKDSRFPKTIRDVIYSGKQFPPAHNGLLDRSVPKANALRAAKDALNGRNNVEDAIYFYNPKVSKGKFWSSLKVIDTVGSHRFAK
jgi:N-acetylmuramoyl-L-alanine amidase